MLGPNGSGKSTFLKVILGLTGLNSGEIRWQARRLERRCWVRAQQKAIDPPPRCALATSWAWAWTVPLGHPPVRTAKYRARSMVRWSGGRHRYANVPGGLLSGGGRRPRAFRPSRTTQRFCWPMRRSLLDLNHRYAVAS